MACRSWLVGLFTGFLFATLAAAEPLAMSGAIVGPDGRPLVGARAALYAVEGEYEAARRWLRGESEPRPLVEAVVDGQGRFRLVTREAGFYVVRARREGFLERELAPTAYVDDVELAPARLERAREVELRVEGPDGAPRAGVWVQAVAPERIDWSESDPWRSAPRRGRTGADGKCRLPFATGEDLTWWVTAPGLAEASTRGAATIRLQTAPARSILVVDAARRPVAAALVLVGERLWPVAATNAAGEASIPASADAARVLTPAAPPWARRLPAAPPQSPATVVLDLAVVLEGRVLDLATRRPIAGALVWTGSTASSARTRADGTYALSNPSLRHSGIRAAARGYADGMGFQATPSRNTLMRGPTIALQPARRLGGRVVDENGTGIEGAEILARPDRQRAPRWFMSAGLHPTTLRARADRDGTFALPSLLAGYPYRLEGRAAGYAPRTVALGAEETTSLVLARGGIAAGRVVDAERRPVAGARAVFTQPPPPEERFFTEGEVGPVATATSDGTGAFAFAHVAPGRYSLEVTAPGFAPVQVPGLEVEATPRVELGTVTLTAEGVVEGMVVDPAGRAVAGAAIAVGKADAESRINALVEEASPSAQASADGWFRVGGLRPGAAVDLTARAPGFGEARLAGVVPHLEADGEGEPLRVVLQPAARSTGRVVDRDQRPLAGVLVGYSIERRSLAMALHAGMRAEPLRTGEDGSFEFRDLPEGILHVSAWTPGYQTAEVQAPVGPGQDALGLEIVMTPGSVVSGRIFEASGVPVLGASVGAGQGRSSGPYARSDADGFYRLDGVAPGKTTLSARHPRGGDTVKEVEVGGEETTVDLVFTGGVSVSGVVLDDGGEPVVAARILLLGPAGGPQAETGQDGSFTVASVRPGDYSLLASHRGHASARRDLAVAEEAISGLELRLGRGATLVGELRGLEFAELPAARVEAQRQEAWESRSGGADFAGRFRLDGLSPGTWSVSAEIPGTGRRANARVTVAAGDQEVPVVLDFGRGISLSGIVRRAGQPLGGARITLVGPTGGQPIEASTRADGSFRVEGLDEGSYDLGVDTGRRGTGYRRTLELDGDQEIEIDLRGATLGGRILDATSREPIAGAEVLLLSAGDDQRLLFDSVTVRTDSRGVYRFADIVEGSWRVRAEAAGHARAERAITLDEEGAEDVDLLLETTEGLVLELSVDGRPASHGMATVLDAAGGVAWSGSFATSDAGRSRLSSVPPGNYVVWVRTRESAPSAVAATVPGPSAQVALVRAGHLVVQVPELASVGGGSVTMVDSAGRPHRLPGWNRLESEFPLSFGRVSIAGVAPGPWTVRARSSDGRLFEGTVTVPPAALETEVELAEK